MATLKEIIYNLQNLREKGIQSDDNKLSDHQLMFMIDQYRAKLIKQDIDKGKPLNASIIQNLGFQKVVPDDVVGEVGGADVFNTVDLPSVIEVNQKNLWTFVGPSPVAVPYQRTTMTKLVWDKHSIYTKALTKWFEMERKIYIASQFAIREVFIMGVFESPFKVREFLGEADYADPFEFEYPISVTMLDSLYKMIAEAEFRIMGHGLEDKLNDGQQAQQPQQQ